MKSYYPTVLSLLDTNASDVIEVGSGDADFLVYLSKMSTMNVCGCDIIEHAGRDRFRKARVYSKLAQEGISKNAYRWFSEKEPLPFSSNSVDAMVSLQVLEHVKNIDFLFSEINRILKPGGTALHYFPSREILIEPHCKIPFAHRIKKKKTSFIRYSSQLGIGKFSTYSKKRNSTLDHFSETFSAYIDEFCSFRFLKEYLEVSHKNDLMARFFPPPPFHHIGFASKIASRFTSVYLQQVKGE